MFTCVSINIMIINDFSYVAMVFYLDHHALGNDGHLYVDAFSQIHVLSRMGRIAIVVLSKVSFMMVMQL